MRVTRRVGKERRATNFKVLSVRLNLYSRYKKIVRVHKNYAQIIDTKKRIYTCMQN